MGKVKIMVTYCGGSGYGPKFAKFQKEIVNLFGEEIEVEHYATPGVTGLFEVQIINGKLLHSKKNGDGYVDSDAKMQHIRRGIEEALAS